MKTKINQELRQINGKPLQEGDQAKPETLKTITLKDILLTVALSTSKEDKEHELEDFQLCVKLQNVTTELDLDNKEASRLQEKLSGKYPILIVGQVNAILEGKENPIKEAKK